MHIPVAAHGHPGHVFGAPGDHGVGHAGCDRPDGHMHGGLGRAALAVDRHAGDGLRPAGRQQRCARDVAALFADLRHAAEHHVIDLLGRDAGAPDEFSEHRGAQMVGPHALESAAEAAHGGAGGLDNDNVAHQKGLIPELGIFWPWSSYS